MPDRLKVLEAHLASSTNGCIEYTGYRNPRGYGKIGNTYTHRLAWEKANGPIPAGQCVCHTCDNPPCCNPEHLFLGTQAENMRDKMAKGRHGDRRGEHNGFAKLTAKQVRDIRAHYRPWVVTMPLLAKMHGVSPHTISGVLRGATWNG